MSRKLLLCVASVMVLAFALGGCSGSLLESKKIDYKSSGKLPPLEIPPDLTSPSRDERYAVPDITPRGTATYSAYSSERSGQARAATSSDVLPDVEKTRIERSGSQRWLVVAQAPDKLWPVVKDFWQELGFIVNLELPDAGIMETDWAENRAKIPQDPIRNVLGKVIDQIYSTPERDKFRTRLEPGAEAGTTEIYISHRGMMEIFTNEARDTTVWQPRPADPELEAEILRRLMVRFGSEDSRARTMLTAGSQAQRAKLQRSGDDSGTLELQEAFDRAWRRVGLALDRVGFTVEDRDRSQGLYYVRYVDPEADNKTKKEERGWISKILFFWKSDEPKGGVVVPTGAQYRVHVKGADANSTVQILTREGGQDKSESAKKILGLLYDQLK
jgi:outer membrane protein assembly factor BamC